MKRTFLPYLLFLLISCSKGPDNDKDVEAPVLTLNAPVNNQVFTAGQTIMISGTASDNKYIKEIHIEISNLITAEQYLHVHIHPGSKSFNFNQSFTGQSGISYKIRVIVDDASSNSTASSVEVSYN